MQQGIIAETVTYRTRLEETEWANRKFVNGIGGDEGLLPQNAEVLRSLPFSALDTQEQMNVMIALPHKCVRPAVLPADGFPDAAGPEVYYFNPDAGSVQSESNHMELSDRQLRWP